MSGSQYSFESFSTPSVGKSTKLAVVAGNSRGFRSGTHLVPLKWNGLSIDPGEDALLGRNGGSVLSAGHFDREMISMVRLRRFSLVVFLIVAFSGCARSPWTVPPQGKIAFSRITEPSGLVVSQRYEDVMWIHNDSKNAPEIFAINGNGKLIETYLVPEAENHDWEDIAIDRNGNLYLLDNASRTDPENRNIIYVVKEPNPFEEEKIGTTRKIQVRFPDGGYDCETLFIWEDSLYFVTKPWDGSLPRVYRHDGLDKGGTAYFIGTIPVSAMITGGDISQDGQRIVLSSYRALVIFEGAESPDLLIQTDPLVYPLNAGQVEGVAWKDESLLLTNEQREIFHIAHSQWERAKVPFLHGPTETVPHLGVKPSVDERLEEWPQGLWLRTDGPGHSRRIGRVAWSSKGLHVGIELPPDFKLRPMSVTPPQNSDDWFIPGSLFLLINPDGTRPLSYQKNDQCIMVVESPDGALTTFALHLRPATVISASQVEPSWLHIERDEQRLLVTVTAETPGLNNLTGKSIGFNLLLIDQDGGIVSWVPLTRPFSWDVPSIWGLLAFQDD